ncbi:MAG: sulfatase-like hydrolase/transferase [Nocardiaceae bacterium]|nr:sulfatase-like hydrolase/transferase [Nocardiaceae bacterium]
MTTSHGSEAAAKHNILFVFTDQERYFSEWPTGMSLPGRERLQRDGVSFRNHYGPAVMCTSSRAVIMTGLQTPDNKMFENADMPYVPDLNPEIPTVGHMLRKAGYYTAYKGKWHLNANFDVPNPDHLLIKEMEAYGFSDYAWPGDVVGHTLGGYTYDTIIGGTAVSWLRDKGRPLADDGKPWALFVSLVNPHDIMYFNTDAPGQPVQDTGKLMMHAAPAPHNAVYTKTWDIKLPDNLTQPMDEPGRPRAHDEFLKSWGYTLGLVPPEEDRWHRFWDFYLNSIRNVDRQLELLLDELDALSLTDNTIVVFTSDHGEMGGSHGLRGKGPFAYQENMHLPLHIMHPEVQGGQESKALTGHIDLAPTLLAMAGATPEQRGEFAGRDLPGRDFSDALGIPRDADLHTVRDCVLFTYSGVATNDSETIRIVSEAKAAHQDPKQAIQTAGYQPDMKKRGTLRAMFDGRYKFTRYFAPTERNLPRTLDDLYRNNDLELFDLENDPKEMTNLAAKKGENEDLVLACSGKLEDLIKQEIGVDDGREMPEIGNIKWQLSRIDL